MKSSERVIVFGILILSLIGGGVFLLWPHFSRSPAQTMAPARTGDYPPVPVRDMPLEIKPTGGFADAVSDDALYYALDTSVPYSSPVVVAQLLHELRLWGTNSPFPVINDLRGRSGEWTLRVLLDNQLCEENAYLADIFDDFLMRTPYGIRILTVDDPGMGSTYSQGHYGQLLQALAEIGVPAATAVTPNHGPAGTIRDLVSDSAARYSPADEPEFMSIAMTRWLQPGATWVDRFGGRHSLDELAHRLAAVPLGEGTCFGGHLPYAITVMLRANEQERLFSAEAQAELEASIKEFSRVLERAQLPDGTWDAQWPGHQTQGDIMFSTSPEVDKITATGHHLEWIALSQPEFRPQDEVVRKAITGLSALIFNRPHKKEQSFKDMLPCSHAARALCLLRGEDAYTFWEREYRKRNQDVTLKPHEDPLPKKSASKAERTTQAGAAPEDAAEKSEGDAKGAEDNKG